MKFLFDEDTFSFETLRTTGFANYFGPIWCEVLATAKPDPRWGPGQLASGNWLAPRRGWPKLGERSWPPGIGSPRGTTCCGQSKLLPHRG